MWLGLLPCLFSLTNGVPHLQVGIIDTGVSVHHQDLTANTQKKCEDFVNGDGSCDEGSIAGPSKVRDVVSSVSPRAS